MTELAKLTWQEARERYHERSVALLPIGATEPHGPHLPLDTDVTIAQAMARRAAEMMAEVGAEPILLPPLAYGLTRFTEGFAGRLTLRPGTLWALLEDVISSLGEDGVKKVVFCNAHLEPEHVAVLRGVAGDYTAECNRRSIVVFPDNTRRRWAQTLGEEFASGDCHAGRYETSIVLASDPEHVREGERSALQPHGIDLIAKMKGGAKTFQEAGADAAYCGDPAAASAEEGRELIEALARMTFTCAQEAWPALLGGETA